MCVVCVALMLVGFVLVGFIMLYLWLLCLKLVYDALTSVCLLVDMLWVC